MTTTAASTGSIASALASSSTGGGGNTTASGSTGAGSTTSNSTGTSISTACEPGRGIPYLQAPISLAAGATPTYVAVGAILSDGGLGLVVADGNDSAALLLNLGSGYSIAGSVDFSVSPDAITLADFDHDGLLDVLATNQQAGNVFAIALNTGDGRFGPATSYAANGLPTDLVVADLEGDSLPELVAAIAALDELDVFPNQGDGGLGLPVAYSIPGGLDRVAVADFTGDGRPDLLAYGSQSFGAVLLTNKSDGGFEPEIQVLSPGPTVLGELLVGDLNNDGRSDVVLMRDSAEVEVLLSWGDGGFSSVPSTQLAGVPTAGVLADLNGDHLLDLAVLTVGGTDGGAAGVTLFGSGDGGFSAPVVFAVCDIPSNIEVLDLNHDGNLDLAVTYANEGVVTLFFGDGLGAFQSQNSAEPCGSNLPVWSDLNGDGLQDAVCTDGDFVLILLGQ